MEQTCEAPYVHLFAMFPSMHLCIQLTFLHFLTSVMLMTTNLVLRVLSDSIAYLRADVSLYLEISFRSQSFFYKTALLARRFLRTVLPILPV